MRVKLLVVEADPQLRERMGRVFEESSFEVTASSGAAEALSLLEDHVFDAVVARLESSEETDLVARIRTLGGPELVFIVIVGRRFHAQAPLLALRFGADDYVTTPVDLDELCLRVEARLSDKLGGASGATTAGDPRQPTDFLLPVPAKLARRARAAGILLTPGLAGVFDVLDGVIANDVSVLLVGETGTGKSILAHYLHGAGPRKSGPFVTANCSSLPGALLASELFGHEEGAFTGASRKRVGRFESAETGTIFLDEIGDMPMELQASLLRVLEDHEFERLGSSRTLRSCARVLAATNTNLPRAIDEGRFRKDLYYRLASFTIAVPPLRQRPDDIPFLARACLPRVARELDKQVDSIDAEAVSVLRAHDWPGNVRELENVLRLAVARARGPCITHSDVMLESGLCSQPKGESQAPFDLVVSETERHLLAAALEEAHGNRSRAARALGIPRTTMLTKMVHYGLGELGRQHVTDEADSSPPPRLATRAR